MPVVYEAVDFRFSSLRGIQQTLSFRTRRINLEVLGSKNIAALGED